MLTLLILLLLLFLFLLLLLILATDSKQFKSEVSLPRSRLCQICVADFDRVLLSDASQSLQSRSDKYGCAAGLGLTRLLSFVLLLLLPLLLLCLLRALMITSLGKAVNPVRACCCRLDGIVIKAEIIHPAVTSREWCGMVLTS